jgi:hypothetical protein
MSDYTGFNCLQCEQLAATRSLLGMSTDAADAGQLSKLLGEKALK